MPPGVFLQTYAGIVSAVAMKGVERAVMRTRSGDMQLPGVLNIHPGGFPISSTGVQ
jgi:hypothetical protein